MRHAQLSPAPNPAPPLGGTGSAHSLGPNTTWPLQESPLSPPAKVNFVAVVFLSLYVLLSFEALPAVYYSSLGMAIINEADPSCSLFGAGNQWTLSEWISKSVQWTMLLFHKKQKLQRHLHFSQDKF